MSYGEGIRSAFRCVFDRDPKCFAIGQGLWNPSLFSPSMDALEQEFGRSRIIDTPLSELACTGAAIGAALCGYRPIVVFRHMDYLILAADQIVNQAAKWFQISGGRARPPITIRCLIDRGGERGAQHAQALHAWFAHIPGLRVVMPSTATDARDLLIESVLCDDPVLYIENRWLYDRGDPASAIVERPLAEEGPRVIQDGTDITLVGSRYATWLCRQAAESLLYDSISAEVVDLRVLNPFDARVVAQSVRKTGRLIVVDDGWRSCGMASEVIAAVFERILPSELRASPVRIGLPSLAAPAGRALERRYYPTAKQVIAEVHRLLGRSGVACAG